MLIGSGTAPSRAKIRAQIGSGGSDATVADELNQFWPQLGSYIKESRVALQGIVAQARKLADSEWQEEALKAQRDHPRRFTDEQIVGILKEDEAGVPAKELCRKDIISDATFYTWRKKFGGMGTQVEDTYISSLSSQGLLLDTL